MSNAAPDAIMDGMDWIIYLIAAAALATIYGFHRFMSGIENRESLEGRGVVGVVVSAQTEGRTVIVDAKNGSKLAATLGIFVVVRTTRGWFESTRQNVPLECRVNPDTSHMSEWVFPDIGDDAIEQIDVRVRTPHEPYRVALRLPQAQEVIYA